MFGTSNENTMEMDKHCKSHNLKLTEITVDDQHLQITREATLRLTVGPSPDWDGPAYPAAPIIASDLSVPERRVIEIWVDGFRQVSGFFNAHLPRLPFDTLWSGKLGCVTTAQSSSRARDYT
jgi:hypothetical protein